MISINTVSTSSWNVSTFNSPLMLLPEAILFFGLLVVLPIIIGLSIWATIRGVRLTKSPENSTQMVGLLAIALTWFLLGYGWIPALLLTRDHAR